MSKKYSLSSHTSMNKIRVVCHAPVATVNISAKSCCYRVRGHVDVAPVVWAHIYPLLPEAKRYRTRRVQQYNK